jgi:hypothetical protein
VKVEAELLIKREEVSPDLDIKTELVDPAETQSASQSSPPIHQIGCLSRTPTTSPPTTHRHQHYHFQPPIEPEETVHLSHHLVLPSDLATSQNLALPAYYLYKQQDWNRLFHYLSTNTFHPLDHPRLQELWYLAHYEKYRRARGVDVLNPSQKYRIRCKKPTPPSISSTKFKANNTFPPRVKAVLDQCFESTPYVSGSLLNELVARTELSSQQIKNYFKNKRNRSK